MNSIVYISEISIFPLTSNVEKMENIAWNRGYGVVVHFSRCLQISLELADYVAVSCILRRAGQC